MKRIQANLFKAFIVGDQVICRGADQVRIRIGFMKLIAKEHGIDLEDCVFVGDGKNDVGPACAVGFSIAFNAQQELKRFASKVIDQPEGEENFSAVAKAIRECFPDRRRKIFRRMRVLARKVIGPK